MKKSLLFLLALSFCTMISRAQQQGYPKGAYISFEELISKSPSVDLEVTIVKRTAGDIKMVGGNDYKLETTDSRYGNGFLKKDVFAFSDGDSLYLNGAKTEDPARIYAIA